MSETTFGILFVLCSVMMTGALLLISRFNRRLTDSLSPNQQWIWSSKLDRAGRWMLVAGNLLMLTGFIIGGLRLLPVYIGGSGVLGGFLCLVLATQLIGGALLWRLHLRYGLRQLTTQLSAAINHHLPEPPTHQTRLEQVLHFSGQFCVGMVIVGWGFLRVIAASGVLENHDEDFKPYGSVFNYATGKTDFGLDPGGIYEEDGI